MNILLIGSGGREHALAWAISRSKHTNSLYIAPGNPGMKACGILVALDISDHGAVAEFCRSRAVSLVVVGPEKPLVDGIADALRAGGIRVFGPSRAAAQLEGSKHFTKILCREMNIPTAASETFDDLSPALRYLEEQPLPVVVKADGLASGKGVTIAETAQQARTAVRACFDGAFGEAGARVVIEEYLTGEEISLFALADGTRTLLLPTAQDHKRALEGDKGPNTGGMGAYSPAPAMTDEMLQRVRADIIEPSMTGLANRGTPFSGVLFAGLMITDGGPRLIEYNVRFGDPECQALMLRLKSDIVDLLLACSGGSLEHVTAEFDQSVAITVVVAAPGYPGAVKTGSEIRGLESINDENVKIFHAGTRQDGSRLVANGGRVLSVTARGDDIKQARDRAYAAIDRIDWPEGVYRRDIAWRAIDRD